MNKIQTMKHIQVVAAAITRNQKVFATQRGYGEFKDWWEFPGGKIEPGETPEQALKREITEELNTQISVQGAVGTVEYDYPTFHITLHCYWCQVISGNLSLLEAEDACWLNARQIGTVNWLPADRQLLAAIKARLAEK